MSSQKLTTRDVWARAVAAGIPDELFWRSTPAEIAALFRAINERESALQRAANLRSGLVAAVLVNIHRKRGKPPVGPEDFFRDPKTERMTIEEAQQFMLSLARARRN